MNRYHMFAWLAILFSEHQKWRRFEVADNESVLDMMNLGFLGATQGAFRKQWVLTSGAQEGGVGWRHRCETHQ